MANLNIFLERLRKIMKDLKSGEPVAQPRYET
jgi:hypothetical protein